MTPEQQARAEALLSERELEALRKLGDDPARRLSPAAAAQFFSLFLQGYGAEEIAKHNPSFGAIGLGLICRARIEYDWDAEKDRYVRNMMAGIRQSVEKATLEGIQFASDGMAVFHRIAGDRFRRYLQTGDDSILGDFREMSFKNYKDFVGLLQTLTGKDSPKTQGVLEIAVKHEAPKLVDSAALQLPQLHDDRPVSAEEAANMLKLFSGDDDE